MALTFAMRDPATPWLAWLIMVAVVAYAASPIDLIPDVIPVLGLLDEIVLLPLAIALAIRLMPDGIMAHHFHKAQESDPFKGHQKPVWLGRMGAIIIVSIWLCVAVLLWRSL